MGDQGDPPREGIGSTEGKNTVALASRSPGGWKVKGWS